MPITGGYTLNHGDRYAGMVVDAQTSNSVSKLNKSGATVPWGVFVARDGDDGFTTVGTGATAADIIGVLRREINRAQADGAASGAPADRDATVLTAGTIYVQTDGAVDQGDAVYVIAGGSNSGKATANAGGEEDGNLAVPGAKFIETTSGSGIAAVSLVIGG